MSLDANQKIIVEGVGEVLVKRRRGQKRTTLRISQKGEVTVGTNYSTPLYAIKEFVCSQVKWISEAKLKQGLDKEIKIYDGQKLSAETIFKIKLSSLEFGAKYFSKKKEIEVWGLVEDGAVKIPAGRREVLEKEVVKALRAEAKKVLPIKLKELAELSSKKYRSVTIRNTSGRWGSCNSKNDINLSLWLMILPQKLVDYVLIHELAHTVHKHHQKSFWAEVARWVPDYKERRKNLKRYSAQIWW
jgi:predicted metal-dependent hydrolase